ncbi:MAG TPA: LacI family DNA-binding transcriptional regulator [Candidatus Izemoplasmatales bacterium]|nr:LacI family DNA-binding transcriptional regulator [Bacillota bacterium]HRY77855.1 LacI family DNA-binding transcriptional regulator [Candidatus Izemoplasmatales bacterium]
MKCTIRDIAREAKVSVTTVSLILNGRPNSVSEPTANRIREIAKKNNYAPNHFAVGLVTKKTNTIGLILPDISNTFFAELGRSVDGFCSAAGYSMILSNTNHDPAKDVSAVNMLVNRGIDGLIIAFSQDENKERSQNFIALLDELEVPFVALDSWIEGLSCPGVSIHHSKGGLMATKHLLSLGHRRIGCITGPRGSYTAERRLKGYVNALTEAGIPFDPDWVATGDYQFESGRTAAQQLLQEGVTAIFASNDLMAYGAYQAVHERGWNVPEDISIVGFDDLFFSAILPPPLTTIHQSVSMLGEQAWNLLHDRLRDPGMEKEYKQLEPDLIIRNSTQAPKGSC